MLGTFPILNCGLGQYWLSCKRLAKRVFPRVGMGLRGLARCGADSEYVSEAEGLDSELQVDMRNMDVRTVLVELCYCNNIYRTGVSQYIASRLANIHVLEDVTNVSFSCCDPCNICDLAMCNLQTNQEEEVILLLNQKHLKII